MIGFSLLKQLEEVSHGPSIVELWTHSEHAIILEEGGELE